MKMNLLKRLIATSFVLIFGLTACTKEKLTGEGSVVTEKRNVARFSKVELSGFRQAEIVYSNSYMVEVTGYENLIPIFMTEVSNDRLILKYPNFTKVNNDNITLKIYTNNLSRVDVSGHSNIKIGNGFVLDRLQTNLSGSSEIYVGEGTCKEFAIHSSGESQIYARNFKSEQADITLSGHSFLEIYVTQKLSANISGEGEIHFWGNPVVKAKISGNGKTIKH